MHLDEPHFEEAMHLAIARAKRRGAAFVTPDDLLGGLLRASARFGIVVIGDRIIDLERLGEGPLEEADAAGPKVAYAPETVTLIDRAAAVARQDRASRTEIVHMLVAFAQEEGGLMGRIRETLGFDATAWRAALVDWKPTSAARRGPHGQSSISTVAAQAKALLSPDEAAELLGVHTQTVRGYIRSGKLTAHRLAGERALRIHQHDVLALLEPFDPD
jgi:excisionase family DNA binding protein